MDTYSLNCKNCGAPLIVAKSAREATCGHCGTRVGITPTKREPDIVILDSPKQAKPPVRPRPIQPVRIEEPYDPAEHRRKEQEEEQIRLARHGANLLDAVTGYRSCLHMIIIVTALGGLLMCGLCVLPGLLGLKTQNNGPGRPIMARADSTDDILESAAREIMSLARMNQELPGADQGNMKIDRYRDEWGRGLRYEKNSTSDFIIRSAGRDGAFDTADDLTEREHSTSIRHTSQTATPPLDLAAALEQLRTPGLYQKGVALEWLIKEKPELDDSHRSAVVESAIRLLKDRGHRSRAQNALTLWAQPSDAPKLSQAAAQAELRDHDFVDTVVIQLIRLKDEDSVMQLMNHSSSSVRASVAVAMSDWNVADVRIVQQCMFDLGRVESREASITRLTSMKLDETQLEEATARVKQLLMEDDSSSVGLVAFDFLEKYDKVDTPLLIKVYDGQGNAFHRDSKLRERTGVALTKRPEPAVFLLFASRLGSRDRQAAERGVTYLKTMGSAAESYVWPSLRSEDSSERERACKLLGTIGTENSLPHLLTIDINGPTGPHAQAAILDIQNANRQPPDSTPKTPTAPSEIVEPSE